MIKVICDNCEGSGRIPLPETLAVVLKAVRQGNETAEQVHASAGMRDIVAVTAINNRLERLRAHGLVQRRREGKFWHYTVTKR